MFTYNQTTATRKLLLLNTADGRRTIVDFDKVYLTIDGEKGTVEEGTCKVYFDVHNEAVTVLRVKHTAAELTELLQKFSA